MPSGGAAVVSAATEQTRVRPQGRARNVGSGQAVEVPRGHPAVTVARELEQGRGDREDRDATEQKQSHEHSLLIY